MSPEDISDFAAANGLLVHPRIDAIGGPAAWVAEVQSAGGCPVAPGRACPCQEAVAECSSEDPMDQHCMGFVFVTPAYMGAVDPMGKLYGTKYDAPASFPKKAPDPEVDAVLSGYLTGVDSAIDQFKSGDFESAFDTLTDLGDNSDCGVCSEEFMVAAVHVNGARNMCSLGLPDACNKEQKRVSGELTKLRAFFADARASEPKKNTKTGYQSRMSEIMNSGELDDYPQRVRFFMSTQLASGKADTVGDAEQIAREKHPEWFDGSIG